VLVYARSSAEVTIPSALISADQQRALQDAIAAKAAAGQLDQSDQKAVEVATLDETAANIFTYFSPDPDPAMLQRWPGVAVTAIGSGFIVSRNGVIVTNAHLVAPGKDVLEPLMLRQAVAAALPFIGGIPASVPADTRQRLADAQLKWAMKYAQVGEIATTLAAFTGASISGVLNASQGTAARVMTAGAAVPGKDVALIKLEGRKTWPTVALGDERGLHVGDRVYVGGYSAAADLNPAFKDDQPFVLKQNQGVVSGSQKMAGGWSAIQTDAATTHGSSGGPVLNSHGEVVGVLSFGSVDASTGQEVQGSNIVVPASVVKEFLIRAGVKF
jgi:serine protease Do